MWRNLLVLALLLVAAPLAASGGEGHGEGETPLGLLLKVVNLIAFFGLLAFLMARPLRAFFEKHTEEIRAALDGSRAREAEAQDLEAQARTLAASVETEAAALRARFEEDRMRIRRDLEASTERALARLRADHGRALAQLEASYKAEWTAHALRAVREEALRSLAKDLTPADRARFLASVTAGGEGA
jgi:F0F1-type ATP synthase membrane subunit b/b'